MVFTWVTWLSLEAWALEDPTRQGKFKERPAIVCQPISSELLLPRQKKLT